MSLAALSLPLALPGILLGLIYSGVTTPTEAAAIAASYALILAFVIYRTLRLPQLVTVITDTVRATAMIAMIMAGAFVFNYAVANENVPQLIRNTFLSWNLSATQYLLCVDVLMLFLAIVLDEVTILLVIVPLLVPIAQGLGIDLVHFGILIVVNMMVGLTLPPHGLLLFVMSGLTGTALGGHFPRGTAFHHRNAGYRVVGDVLPGDRALGATHGGPHKTVSFGSAAGTNWITA